MVTKVKWIVLLGVILCSIIACQGDELKYEFPYDGDKLVLNAWLSPEGVKLYLGFSQNLNQIVDPSGNDTIANAVVWLLDGNGQKLSRVPYLSKGFYSLDIALSEGYSYQLTAETDGFPIAISQPVIIPPSLAEVAVELVEKNETAHLFSITLKDISSLQDFYLISPLAKREGEDIVTSVFTNFEDNYLTQCSIADDEGWIVFGDPCFNNSSFQFTANLYLQDTKLSVDSIGLAVGTTTELFYSYVDNLNQPDAFIEQFFAAPNLLSSNVEGGYGLVAGRNARLFWFH